MKKVLVAACAVFVLAGMARAAVDQMDEKFVKTVCHKGAMEVAFAKMAQAKSTNADVKNLGKHMEADHTKANEELKTIAGTLGAVVDGQHADHRTLSDKMTSLQGAEFDREFVGWTVKSHMESIDLLKNYIRDGKQEQVKAFATKTLPVLQHHLEMAQQCQATLGKGASLDKKAEQPMDVKYNK